MNTIKPTPDQLMALFISSTNEVAVAKGDPERMSEEMLNSQDPLDVEARAALCEVFGKIWQAGYDAAMAPVAVPTSEAVA